MNNRYFSPKQVLAILREIFPERDRLSLSHLTYYRKRNLVGGDERRVQAGQHGDSYSLRDVVLLVWMLDLWQRGLCGSNDALGIKKAIQRIDFETVEVPIDTIYLSGRVGALKWSYPIGQTYLKVVDVVKSKFPKASHAATRQTQEDEEAKALSAGL